MLRKIPVSRGVHIDDYAELAYLAPAVHDLRSAARLPARELKDRTIWMLNSTAVGGGVAEMMPCVISMLRDLGVKTEWLVMEAEDPAFFKFTKRIHNLIHDSGDPHIGSPESELYHSTAHHLADMLHRFVKTEDILVVHDPQPLGGGAEFKRRTGSRLIWRCHIGLDRRTPLTDAAWEFLRPHAEVYDHSVFSAAEYIPAFLAGKASVAHPSIDPLSHKNRELSVTKLAGIMSNSGLVKPAHPVLTPDWDHRVRRLQPDGTFAPADVDGGVGLPFRPIITQISRWDHLKGWAPLLQGFLRWRSLDAHRAADTRQRKRMELARLVLAGPEPSAIQDDPEAQDVLAELSGTYAGLAREAQESVAVLSLPMSSRKQNHLAVNVLQRCSSLVVQNSIQEGFGLTATEAMWKRVPVLGSSACGLRLQIRDGIDGRLTSDPNDPEEVAAGLNDMLRDPVACEHYGRNAQRHVFDRFLVFHQVEEWIRRLADAARSIHRVRPT